MKDFLYSKFTSRISNDSVPKQVKYVKLPFYGKVSFNCKKRLKKILNNAFPSIDFRFVFINDFKISSFFLESKIKFLTKFALKYAISLLVLAVMLGTWDAQIELSTSV